MIDINLLRNNPQYVKEKVKSKGVEIDIDKVLTLDKLRRQIIKELDDLRAKQKRLGRDELEEAKIIKNKIKEREKDLWKREEEFNQLFLRIPNLPLDDTPQGIEEKDNVVLREVGVKPKFNFIPRDYIEIGKKLDLIDTDSAAKVSGARFGYLKNQLALMEFAIVNFVFNFLTNPNNIKKIIQKNKIKVVAKSFIAVVPPVMVKPEIMRAMGYMERGEEEIYHLEKDDLYLVGTSEQSLGPIFANSFIERDKLPIRLVGFSTCFRREAGSYGKDTKGILRVHQFDKIEMFIFSRPETSREEHRLLLTIEETLMQQLKLPYRVVNICTGDLGDPAAAKYDIEAWLPGQNNGKGEYRETHSTSNTTDFQARRLNIRFKDENGKTQFVHTLNGTAFAIGRILIAIIENYQKKDGSVEVPKALRKYLDFKIIK